MQHAAAAAILLGEGDILAGLHAHCLRAFGPLQDLLTRYNPSAPVSEAVYADPSKDVAWMHGLNGACGPAAATLHDEMGVECPACCDLAFFGMLPFDILHAFGPYLCRSLMPPDGHQCQSTKSEK